MLTLKEPIKLNTADGLTTVSDAFYQRICGNYGMMTANITPKELLFFLSAPPELPEDLGGMTTFAVQNNISDNRTVTMDVINNMVNRIILSQTNDFTYQDQIYIESVLNKLGITDISLFMKQVQKLQSEHTDMHQLMKLYTNELRLKDKAPLPEEREQLTGADTRQPSQTDDLESLKYFLHSEIYKRLDTKTIYDIVNSFQSEQWNNYGSLSRNELKTAEQTSVRNLLALSELRQRVINSTHLSLTHAVNHFELGDLLPEPKTEDEVLSQAAAAALVSTVEHVLVQSMKKKLSDSVWKNLKNSLSETVVNTIARFQSYHSGETIYLTPEADLSVESSKLYKTELKALKELVSLRERYFEAARASKAMGEAMSGATMDFPELQSVEEINLEYDLRAGTELLRETVSRQQATPRAEESNIAPLPSDSAASPDALHVLSGQGVLTESADKIINQFIKAETQNIDKSVTKLVSEIEQTVKAETAQNLPPKAKAETVHPISDAEAPAELIAQEVAEINRRNRERFQQLQETRAGKIAESVPVPDQKRIMSDALRSLEAPEAVLKQVLEQSAQLEHPSSPMTPETAAYLSAADETTRSILETVMRFERDPMGAAQSGVLREANLGELNSIALSHPPLGDETLNQAIRPEKETVKLIERAETILEQYSETPSRRVYEQRPGGPLPRVPIIHKQEQNSFSEELLEKLEEQRTSKHVNKEVVDVFTQNDMRQTVQNDVTTQVVTQSSEDITQLVNRALSKQMNTITDKVYHQMEKRLQTERSRRGRF